MTGRDHVFSLRCPNDTDPAHSDRHVAVDFGLPMTFAVFEFVGERLSKCACGADMVTTSPVRFGAPVPRPTTPR